ncbi:hypothetical protein ACLMJK_002872 [Lecanora helva]
MAVPQPAMIVPREITHSTLHLPHKPSASIHYTFTKNSSSDRILVVFLNGLMSDKTSWIPVIAGIIRQRQGTGAGFPSMLAYDRYGQGMTSDRDPQDEGKEPGHGHDCASAAEDLHHLVQQVAKEQMNLDCAELRMILVANSIGCAIARLYAHAHPVTALLFLDSIMANSNFDLWPDPDLPLRPEDIGDVTVDELKEQRAKFAAIFHPFVINKEGLSRQNLAELLPFSDRPAIGGKGNRPWLTVVGHDFDAFAQESLRTMGTPIFLSMKYSNPVWHAYNQGLIKLTEEDRRKGPIQAKGCGHFIQRDDPNFVVDETLDLVDKVRMEQSAVW